MSYICPKCGKIVDFQCDCDEPKNDEEKRYLTKVIKKVIDEPELTEDSEEDYHEI